VYKFTILMIMAVGLSSTAISQLREGSVKTASSQFFTAAGVKDAALTEEQLTALQNLRQNAAHVQAAWSEFNSTPTFLVGTLTATGYLQKFSTPSVAATNFLNQNRILFKLASPSDELEVLNSEKDDIGMTHVRLQQVFKGLKVIGSQIIVHFDANGAVSSVNGRYVPTPEINVGPAISQQQAFSTASLSCGGRTAKSSELAIYLKDYKPVLAYKVSVPTEIAPMQRVIVDAVDGTLLDVDTGIRYDGPDVGSGPGVSGTNRSLNIYLSGGKYYLIDATKPMYVSPIDSLKGVVETYDAKNDTTSQSPYASAALVFDPNGDKVFNDSPSLSAAVDAHYFSGKVYDYYKTHFNRNSWDNKGGSVINAVHYLYHYNNAFWNGVLMSYGDGDGVRFSNLAGAYDVIVHEITHGVTGSTAGLEYRGQSGALNESYSDVFATMADSANWKLAEDVYTPATPGDALRDMSNPHQGGSSLSDPGWQPAYMSEYLYLPYTTDSDHGGVHINSGIPNFAAYLVASKIGRSRTEQIYYRTLVHYLTPKSFFIDARNASLQSAADLYGSGGAEYNAVAAAFDSVGIKANLPRADELAYDDGSPASGVYETDASWGLANRLTAPGSGKLVNVEYVYLGDNNSAGNGTFTVKVFGNNAGQPGSTLFASAPFTPPSSAIGSWIPISIASQNISVNGDFYVGAFYDGINQPLFGVDTGAAANGRAWEWDATQSKWVTLDKNSYYPVTLFIRAIVNTVTGVHQISNQVPKEFALMQNYPNPFNPTTKIEYALPKESFVSLKVYDLLGREVTELVAGKQSPGSYRIEWNGTNGKGASVSSGIYFCRLQVGEKVFTRKMVMVR